VTIPILAGILPATEARRLRRVEELTGVAAPADLLRDLDRLTAPDGVVDAEAQHEHGLQYSTALAREVLDAGAPGVHVYTFNKHRPALDLLERVGLTGRAAA
jgi:methylenetetrahydrofolate reductase (NADPH)